MKKIKNGWYPDEHNHLVHYVNDKFHNEKVPAVIWDVGSKFWIQNGKDHRLGGPAAEWNDTDKDWYYQGKHVECKSQEEFERYLRLKSLW